MKYIYIHIYITGKQNATKNLLQTQLLFELFSLCIRFLGTLLCLHKKEAYLGKKESAPPFLYLLKFLILFVSFTVMSGEWRAAFLICPQVPFLYLWASLFCLPLILPVKWELCKPFKPLPSAPMWPLMSLHPFPSCLLVLFTWLCGCTFKIINPNKSQLLCGAVRCARTCASTCLGVL